MNSIVITCNKCMKVEHIRYSATNMNKLVDSGWDSFGDDLYCPDCARKWHRWHRGHSLWGKEHTIKKFDELYEMQSRKIVTEYCPECEREIEMYWDVEVDGYQTFCPSCGERLMLCDDCDFDTATGSCRFSIISERGDE